MKLSGKIQHLLAGVGLIAVGALILWLSQRPQVPRLKIGNTTILVDVADSDEEITKGLSGREAMAQNRGMLFVFSEPRVPSFWMKDMLFPIDFVWIDEAGKIVAITPSIGTDSYPITFSPPSEVKYVLEVNAGISALRGWIPGDSVEFKL